MKKRIGIIIPARYESTRLPGKPLIDLQGKSMIQRTWERCISALPSEMVYVATENEEISAHVKAFGGNVIMTSDSCLTGTDRLAEANSVLQLDLVINVQGDEPIIDPKDIQTVIQYAQKNDGMIVNAIAPINEESEFRSSTIPKVAKTLNNDLLYMSRSPIPGNKSAVFNFGYKQICIYAFPKTALQKFISNSKKTPFEEVEDIEILRFLELGLPVKLIEVSGNSMAVDIESDVHKVIEIIKNIEQ
jgi:3-deoxy-manno-octulosonate cytidylyltransferase (CMP-KDO synthetase)